MFRAKALRQIESFQQVRAFVDGLVHETARKDPLASARHATVIGLHLLVGAAALCALPGVLAWRGGVTPADACAFAFLVGALAVALLLSRTGSMRGAQIASAALTGCLAVMPGAAAETGWSAGLVLLPLAPLVASLSAEPRVVALSGLIGLAGALGAGLLHGAVAAPLLAGLVTLAATGLVLAADGIERMGTGLSRSGAARGALLADLRGDLLLCHGPGGRVTGVSPGSEALLGLPAEVLFGQGLFDRVHVADRPAFLSVLAGAQRGEAGIAEIRLRREDEGTVRFVWLEMRCRPPVAPGETEAVSVLHDIGARKTHELALEAARVEAERSNAAKSRFLATMSHELRTPLNAVIGFSELLLNEDAMLLDKARRREYAGLIRDSGEHLLSVVNGILDMSRLETGNFALVAEPFRIEELLEGCRAMVALKAETGRIRLETSVEPGLPDLVADKRACRQICINLLSNALKFTPGGGRVTIGARAERGGIAFFVADTGVGIAREDVGRLGEPFFQASAAYDRSHEGTGLGLSVVKGLVALHGGHMEVASTLGAGTTVTVRLPLDCENEAERRAFAPPAEVERLFPRTDEPDEAQQQVKKRA